MLRKLSTLAVATLLVTSLFAAPASAALLDDTTSPEIVRYGSNGTPSFIVEFENDSYSSLADWAAASASREIIDIDNSSNTATVTAAYGQVVDLGVVAAATGPGTVRDALSADPLATRSYIRSIAPNYRVERTQPVGDLMNKSEFSPTKEGRFAFDDPEFATDGMAFNSDANQSTLAEARDVIGADAVAANGSGTTTAIIDTGINTAGGRLGLEDNVLNASKNFLTGKTVNESGLDAVADGNGHGTWVASSIAANPNTSTTGETFEGVAPGTQLLVLKALADDGSGSTSDIAAAIRYAADNGADVISMSLGAKVYSEPIQNAIAYAHENGVSAVVVAAGNSRVTRGAGLATPGDVPEAITVGATNTSTNATAASAYFSQVGPEPATGDLGGQAGVGTMVDVAAPGMEVTAKVASEDGFVSNSTLSGTSMATPLVAGSIAVAMDANSTLADANHSAVHDAVTASAKPVPNAASVEVGHGLVNVDNLAAGQHPATSQEEAMDSAAQQRDTYYRALYQSQGGFLATVRQQVGV